MYFFSDLPTVIIASAKALAILCVRCVTWAREKERERERERERETERQRERERERERGSERETEVMSPLSRWSWRWVYTFPCQKFALFVSPFLNGHHCGGEIRNEFTHNFRCQKSSHSLLRQMAWGARRGIEKPKTNYLILLSLRLFFPTKKETNQINTKTYSKEKKRLCVRWLRVALPEKIYRSQSTIRPLSWRNTFLMCALQPVNFLR